jgi:hypothetical protein
MGAWSWGNYGEWFFLISFLALEESKSGCFY